MKPTKLSIAFFVILLILFTITMVFAFKPANPNQEALDRLDEISKQLTLISDQQADLTGKIQSMDMQYRDLNDQANALNDEASAIFMKLVDQTTPEDLEVSEEEVKEENLHTCAHGDGETYRGIKWRCNSNGMAQDIPELVGSGRHERMKELLNYYGQGDLYDTFMSAAKASGIYPELGICIAKADTSLGKALKTTGNIGNVGNTDSGSTQSFRNNHAGVLAIFQTLNNQFLGGYTGVNQLSRYGNKDGKIYAGSPENWHANVMNCLSVINEKDLPDDWNFRF